MGRISLRQPLCPPIPCRHPLSAFLMKKSTMFKQGALWRQVDLQGVFAKIGLRSQPQFTGVLRGPGRKVLRGVLFGCFWAPGSECPKTLKKHSAGHFPARAPRHSWNFSDFSSRPWRYLPPTWAIYMATRRPAQTRRSTWIWCLFKRKPYKKSMWIGVLWAGLRVAMWITHVGGKCRHGLLEKSLM